MILTHKNLFFSKVRATLVAGALLAVLAVPGGSAAAVTGATITVDSSADDDPPTPTGNCTLREAITAANTNIAQDTCTAGTTGVDNIVFDVAVTNITTTTLPAIIAPVNIDGSSGGVPTVHVHSSTPGDLVAFDFETGSKGSTLQGFKITDYSRGVFLGGTSGGVTIVNNWIGTSDGETNGTATNTIGIQSNSPANHIGLPGAPVNLISGNAIGVMVFQGTGTFVQNNWIGLDKDGMTQIKNQVGVDVWTTKTLVGGSKPGEGNVISGSVEEGIGLHSDASGTKIQRNFIGTNAAGTAAVGNFKGIEDRASLGTLIGGKMPAESNLISGNTFAGVEVNDDSGVASKSYTTISGNLFGVSSSGTSLPNTDAVRFNLAGATSKVKLAGNLIANSTSHGIDISDTFSPTFISSTNNCIDGNLVGAGGPGPTTPFNLKNNWWGASNGPGGVFFGGSGDPVTVNAPIAQVVPFLKVAPKSCLGWAPGSTKPAHNGLSANVTTPTKFSWAKVPTASNYTAPLGTGTAGGGITGGFDGADGPNPTFTTTNPLNYGRYFWLVNTQTNDGYAWIGPVQTLYVTIQKTPKPASVSTKPDIKFTWSKITDATYTLHITSDTTCVMDVVAIGSPFAPQTTTSLMVNGIPDGNYAWTISVASPSFTGNMPCVPFSVDAP